MLSDIIHHYTDCKLLVVINFDNMVARNIDVDVCRHGESFIKFITDLCCEIVIR